MIERQFCAEVCRTAHEPFIGTAAHANVWLLLEYAGPWGSSALNDSEIPMAAKSWIQLMQNTIPHFRPQLIRQDHTQREMITCFIAITREDIQRIYRFQLRNYEELLSLDLNAMDSGSPIYDHALWHAPLFLVCTHGKHDMCCAKFGMPVYRALSRVSGLEVWQSSHVGGDKYAANVLSFPEGLYYGRMNVGQVSKLLQAIAQDQIILEKFRGRSCYSPMVQAADYYLRKQTGKLGREAYRLFSTIRLDENRQRVTFEDTQDMSRYQLTLIYEQEQVETFSTCKGDAMNTIHRFRLEYYEVLQVAMVCPL